MATKRGRNKWIVDYLEALPFGRHEIIVEKNDFGQVFLKPEGALILQTEDRSKRVTIVPGHGLSYDEGKS